MLDGVLQQVRHRAAEERALQPGLGLHVALDDDLGTRLVEHELEELDGLAHFLRHRREYQPGRHLATVGAREKKHVVDDGAHPFQVFEVGLQHLLELAGAALARERHLRAADEVGQRRAQLVRHVGVEGFELAVGFFEPAQRAVECFGQRREFHRQRLRAQPLRQRLGPQRLRLLRQPLQRPQSHAGDPVAREGHHQHRAQPERDQRTQESLARARIGLGVAPDDQSHRRPLLEGIDVHRQGTERPLLPRQLDHAGVAVGLAGEPVDLGQALAVLEARVVAEHPEAHAAVFGREGVHARLHARPALGAADGLDPELQALECGVELLVLVPLQLSRQHVVQREAGQREGRERHRREHQHQPRGDGALHEAAPSPAPSRSSIT